MLQSWHFRATRGPACALHFPADVPGETWSTLRIRHLKALHVKWTAELEQLPPSSERRTDLVEALDDLLKLIERLERETPLEGRDPTAVLAPTSPTIITVGARRHGLSDA